MIFAAGLGTRMGALTQNQPKPLIEVAGRSLIDHALLLVEGFGADRIVVNLHYKGEMLRDHLQARGVQFSEESDILETGGGLKAALHLLGQSPVFTMNSDAVWSGPNPLDLLARQWKPDEMDALLLCIPPVHAIGHQGQGDFHISDSGALSRGPGVIYSGLQIMKTDRLATIADSAFSLNVVWNQMLQEKRLFGAIYPGHWCDVGHPSGIHEAEKMLDDHSV